jgi:hypothetical protein
LRPSTYTVQTFRAPLAYPLIEKRPRGPPLGLSRNPPTPPPPPSSSKNSKKPLDFYCILDFLSLKKDVNVPSESNKQKTFFK